MYEYIGQKIGNYRLLRFITQELMSLTYLGEHTYIGKSAAIKIPYKPISNEAQDETYEAILTEGQILARLHHPHVVEIYEFGIEEKMPYLAMEYIPNGTLRERHLRSPQPSLQQIVLYLKQIASTLDYIHKQHVVHCNIKPENFWLNAENDIILNDFSIAFFQEDKDPRAKNLVGTPRYMAPEHIRGNPCAASDQYALGLIVYEWLTGKSPFVGSMIEIFSQRESQPPPSLLKQIPGLPLGVEEVVFRALEKEPDDRFPCVQDFADALEDAYTPTQPRLQIVSLKPSSDKYVSVPITSTPLSSSPLWGRPQNPLLPSSKEEVIQTIEPIKLFYCYAPQDKKLRDRLETHLMVLKRLRQITLQLNREITTGTDWKQVQDERFNMADLILILISPDFIASDYHYGIEMHNALEKHGAGNVQVIPILLRPTPSWRETPLGTLQILPKSEKPITEYKSQDSAFVEVVGAIREAVSLMLTR
ncbi:MAG TPA: protein kinase [Ktedonobacteraceae bacterium]|nr:protein kinase [Ktedonobacteraceae bacterium]